MKKIIGWTAVYLFVVVLSACDPEEVWINDITFKSATLNKAGDKPEHNLYDVTDAFTKDMVFILSYDLRNYASIDLGLSNNCYAFTRGKRYKNSLLEETFSLSFDQPFEFEGRIVEAGTDLFQVPEIRSHISMFKAAYVFDYSSAEKVIAFDNAFFTEAEFSEEPYETIFKCKTSDGIEFVKTKTVSISKE